MAGIGFDLRRLLSTNAGMLSKVRAYASAGMISSGPWIITMLGLALVGLTRTSSDGDPVSEAFLALMTYVFAFSLLTVSGLQMAFTRWLADTLYSREYHKIVPSFIAALGGVGALQTATALTFSILSGHGPELTFVLTALYVVVSLTWVALVWLSVIRQYERILIAFLAGIAAFWTTLYATGDSWTLVGTLGAYAVGAGLTLTMMIGLILRGTEISGEPSNEVYTSVQRYPSLIVIGTLYGLSIWIDKFVFWFAEGVEAYPNVWSHPLYDSSFFLAYLTVVPALTINLVHLETSFYERYRSYFAAILGGFPLATIDERRVEMLEELRYGAIKLVRIQGAITLLFVLFAGKITAWLEMPELATRVFRFACLGAFFHVMLLITLLVQLYFDLRRQALISAAAFLGLNAALALWSLDAGVRSYGIGYALAGLLGLIIAFGLLNGAMKRLNYTIFMLRARC